MSDYISKINNFMFKEIQHIQNPRFLEFGVKEGRSTKIFLDLCKKNNGRLISVDINDYSNIFDDINWKFIKCRDDNFEIVEKNIKSKFDVIYLDSLHEADHVEKIFYYYYDKLKTNGYFFIDDISWLPYLQNSERDNFYCEMNNKETFNRLLDIYNNNQKNIEMHFSFFSSGMCKIIKKKEYLNLPLRVVTREKSLKNLIRKIKFIK